MTDEEAKECFNSYMKAIEPYLLLFFCFFVIPDMLARFEASSKSPGENANPN
jgi:hypothetical protein